MAAQKQALAQVDRAEAAHEHAALQHKRIEKLFEGGAVMESQRDEARLAERTAAAEVKTARFGAKVAAHEVRAARVALEHFENPGKATEHIEIRAPVSGRILRVLQESEGEVLPSAPLVELGDPEALEVVVDVLTSDAVRIARGASAELSRWGGPPLAGRVRLVEPSAFTRLSALGVEEQRVNVIIDLESPHGDWAALGDRFAVEASISLWHGDDVLKVPASAVFRHGDAWALFVVTDGTARRREVEVGHRSGGEVQIVRGIDAGEAVIVHPGDRISDGAEVEAR
jgi:HlyD family secretion protein